MNFILHINTQKKKSTQNGRRCSIMSILHCTLSTPTPKSGLFATIPLTDRLRIMSQSIPFWAENVGIHFWAGVKERKGIKPRNCFFCPKNRSVQIPHEIY